MNKEDKNRSVDKILNQIMTLASGQLDYRESIDGTGGEMDAIAVAINMLGEETQAIVSELKLAKEKEEKIFSEKLELEQNLRQTNELYRIIIESTTNGVTIADANENVLFANSAAENIFGVPSNGLVKRNLLEFVHDDGIAKIISETEERKKGKKTTYEVLIIRPDNQRRYIEVTATPFRNSEEGYEASVGIFTDITERKLREQSIINRERFFAAISQTIPDIVTVFDLEKKRMIYSNAFIEKILGYTSDEFKSFTFDTLQQTIHPNDLEKVIAYFNSVLQPDFKDNTSIELRIEHKKGTYIWFENRTTVFERNQDGIVKLLNITKDITARKHNEQNRIKIEELEETNTNKDKFISILAHDLKNPFTIILNLIDFLNKRASDMTPEKLQNYLGLLHSCTQNTYTLLTNLLEWSRLQQGRIKFYPEKVNLDKLVARSTKAIKSNAEQKDIRIIYNNPLNINLVVDKGMLSSVLRNLVTNAIKFTNRGGTVKIETIISNNQVHISVIDNGIGMSENTISKLFKVESGLTTRGTEDEQGTGLGLILCKEFIEKHNGSITITSELGKGSTFTISLPLAEK